MPGYTTTITYSQGLDGNFTVRFPYNPDVVELVKQIPGARYQASNKTWSVPSGRQEDIKAAQEADKVRTRDIGIELDAKAIGHGSYPCLIAEQPTVGDIVKIRDVTLRVEKIRRTSVEEGEEPRFVEVRYVRVDRADA